MSADSSAINISTPVPRATTKTTIPGSRVMKAQVTTATLDVLTMPQTPHPGLDVAEVVHDLPQHRDRRCDDRDYAVKPSPPERWSLAPRPSADR
jgi:hypothetical protein